MLPGADVTAIQTDTGVRRSVVTNETGDTHIADGAGNDGGLADGSAGQVDRIRIGQELVVRRFRRINGAVVPYYGPG